MSGIWKFWKSGITLNEGAGPFNFTMLFPWSSAGPFVYIYIRGWQYYWPRNKTKQIHYATDL